MLNPFDLQGPEFLLFYLVLGIVTIGFVWLLRRVHEGEAAQSPMLNDYLEIAYLRGGPNEALRVATMNLINRGLIEIKADDRVHAADPTAARLVSKQSERGILEKFSAPDAASTLFSDTDLRRTVTEECRPPLARLGLLPDDRGRAIRALLLVIALLVLASVAALKILVALSRGRFNIIFLIVEAALFCVLLYKVTNPFRTPAGNALLSDLRTLCAGLEQRAGMLVPGVESQDFALLVAVFGMSAIPPAFSFNRLFPKANASQSSCGSGCGSASSCGSSCGGGICGGGCGGCGS